MLFTKKTFYKQFVHDCLVALIAFTLIKQLTLSIKINHKFRSMFQRSPTPKKKGNLRTLPSENDPTRNKQKHDLLKTQSRQKLSKNSTGLIKNLGFDNPKSSLHDPQRNDNRISMPATGTIIKHLDERDLAHTHKYKQLKNHNKNSDIQQTKSIIEELLNKHAVQRSLSLSQQYILTGYLGKYIEAAKKMHRLTINPFNIMKRLETKNNINSINFNQKTEENLSNSPRKTNRSLTNNKKKNTTAVDQKKNVLSKELQKLKFLWLMYKLKCLTCPQLNKIGEFNESESHKEMTQLILRLKQIQRNRRKAGEEKSLVDVQKVMRNFQQTMKKCLC